MTEVRARNLKRFFSDWPKNLHGAWLLSSVLKKNMAAAAILKTRKKKIRFFYVFQSSFRGEFNGGIKILISQKLSEIEMILWPK